MTENKIHRTLDLIIFGFAALAIFVVLLTRGSLYPGAPKAHPHPAVTPVYEDSPRWNCLTMGNKTCGSAYKMVDDTSHPEVWKAMIREDHRNYDPYKCLIQVASTSRIVCQDGWTETS